MKRYYYYVVWGGLILFNRAPIQAQSSAEALHQSASRIFMISEVGFSYRVNPYEDNSFNLQRRKYYTSELGLLKELNPNYAWGGNLFVGMDEGGEFRGGLKLRLRKGISQSMSVDFAPGILLLDSRAATNPGFMSSVAIDFNDKVALTAQLEMIPTNFRSGTDTALYTGIRFGSKVGAFTNALFGGVAAVIGLYVLFAGIEG